MPRCSQKDRSCYICDADKHPQLEKQTRLCDACRKKLQGKKSFKLLVSDKISKKATAR
jgi:hypothetical protein